MNHLPPSHIPDIIDIYTVNNGRGQPTTFNPLHKRTKSDHLLDNLVHYLIYPEVNGSRIFLRKNRLGTKYVVKDSQIIFLGEDKLIESLKSDAYFQINKNMSDKVIKSALQIISGRHDIWTNDTDEERITPIRVMPTFTSGFIYTFDGIYNTANNNYNFRAYAPKGILGISPIL